METRVYVINVQDFEFDTHPESWSDEKFISESEIQGGVYSLKGFQKEFNENCQVIHANVHIIRFINVPLQDESIIKVNSLELGSNLAHMATCSEMGININDGLNVKLMSGENYTEVAQDIFNKWYDYFNDVIIETKI